MSHMSSLLAILALLALFASTANSLPAGADPVNYSLTRNVAIPAYHPPASSPPDEFSLLALKTLNKMRTASGLNPLCITAKLQKASQEHSNWMSQTQIFEHSKFGFMENIAVHGEGYYLPGKTCFGNGAEKAVDLKSSAEFTTNCQWKNSDGHYKNMMNPAHTRAGIAYAIGPFDGFKGYWWTQNFDSSDEPCIAGSVGSVPIAPPRASASQPAPSTTTSVATRSKPTASSATVAQSVPAVTSGVPKTTPSASKSVTTELRFSTSTTSTRFVKPVPTQTTTTTKDSKPDPTPSDQFPAPSYLTESYAQTSTVARSSASAVATAVPANASGQGGKDKCLPLTKADKYSY